MFKWGVEGLIERGIKKEDAELYFIDIYAGYTSVLEDIIDFNDLRDIELRELLERFYYDDITIFKYHNDDYDLLEDLLIEFLPMSDTNDIKSFVSYLNKETVSKIIDDILESEPSWYEGVDYLVICHY